MQRFLSALPIRWALLLVTGLWSILAVAQSTCPELKVSDFKVNYYAANADCGTAGQIIVTYRNNVAGFSKLTYETSTDGATWANPVEQTSLSVPTTIPLTGWTAGQTIHLRVTGTCPSGTQEVTFPTLTHRSEQPHAVAPVFETTPAGGCSATAGSIDVSVGEVSGFTKAEYFLYQGTTLLNSMTSNTPYAESTFYNLPSGTYKVVMRATPACTPASPGAAFKNGAYEVEQTVKVGYFSILPTPIPTRGTACAGGVRVAVARVMGVNGLKYEVLPSGGGAALQTEQLVYPNFTHTFLNLPGGNYELRATSDCGTVETVPFTIPIGGAGTLSASALQGTYAHCSIGKILATVPGTSVACPVDYVLTPTGSTPGSPITKTSIITENILFEGLAAGTYDVKATWAGQTQTMSMSLPTESLGNLKFTSTAAEMQCDASGALKVELENGAYFEDGTLSLFSNGTLLRTKTISATAREYTFGNLTPGLYTVSYRTTCGETITEQHTIETKQPMEGYWSFEYPNFNTFTGCGETASAVETITFTSPNAAWAEKFVKGLTYEVYALDGTFLSSAALTMKRDNAKPNNWLGQVAFPVSEQQQIPLYVLKILLSCGTPIFQSEFGSRQISFSFTQRVKVNLTSFGDPCTASASLKVSPASNGEGNLRFFLPPDGGTFVLKNSSGTVVGTLTAQDIGGNSYPAKNIISNLSSGDYTWEFYYNCDPSKKQVGAYTIPAKSISGLPVIINHSCQDRGSIRFDFKKYSDGYSVEFKDLKATLTNLDTGEITEKSDASSIYNLAIGKYQIRVTSKSCVAVDTTFTVEIKPKEDYLNNCISITNNGGVSEVTLSWPSSASYTPVGPVKVSIRDDADGTEVWSRKYNSIRNLSEKFSGVFLQNHTYTVTAVFDEGCEWTFGTNLTLWWNSGADNTPEVNWQPLNLLHHCSTLGKGSGLVWLLQKGKIPDDKPIKVDVTSENSAYHKVYNFPHSNIKNRIDDLNIGTAYTIAVEYDGKTYTKSQVMVQSTMIGFRHPPIEYTYAWSKASPCSGGYISMTSPAYNNTDITFRVISKNSGQVWERKAVAPTDTTTLLIPNLPSDTYTYEIVYRNGCGVSIYHSPTDITIPEEGLQPSIWQEYATCPSDGKFRVSISNGEHLDEVVYTLSGAKTGTSPVLHDATQIYEFTDLPPGTYTIDIVAKCGSKQFTYTSYPLTIMGTYQTLTAVNYPGGAIPSPACAAEGALGIDIQGGPREQRGTVKVYLTKGPSGPIVPKQEIQRGRGNYTWGENLEPGLYDVEIFDGCKRIERQGLEVPLLADAATVSFPAQCIQKTANCLWNVRLEFAGATDYRLYEVAIVSTGGTPSGIGASVWNNAPIWKNETRWYYDTDVDLFAPGGFDLLLRLKACPASERRVHVSTPPTTCCSFSLNERYGSDCKYQEWVMQSVAFCDTYTVKLTNTTDNVVVYNKLLSFYDYRDIPRDFRAALKMLKEKAYTLEFIPPTGSPIPPCSFNFPAKPQQIDWSQGISYGCNDARLNLYLNKDGNSSCAPPAKFKVYAYNSARGALLDESPLLNTPVWTTKSLPQNASYYIEILDAQGHNIATTTSNRIVQVGSTSPVTYTHKDVYTGGRCSEKTSSTIQDAFWKFNNDNLSPLGRRDYMTAITITGADGSIWKWDTINGIRRYKSDGVTRETQREDYPAGVYHFSVEDCHTPAKTGTFNVIHEPPAIFDMNETRIVKDCDGGFTITPKGKVTFPDDPSAVTTIVRYGFTANNWEMNNNYGTSFKTYEDGTLRIYFELRFPDYTTCIRYWDYDLSQYALAFDYSQVLSYYCDDAGTGIIRIAAKQGTPPYIYTLKQWDGTVVQTLTGQMGAATFTHGKAGDRYHVEITDACRQETLFQDVTISDVKQLSKVISQERFFCDGATTTFSSVLLPGATFKWIHPNGTITTDPKVTIVASAATAGDYNLEIKPDPLQCSTTIKAKVTINVANVTEQQSQQTVTICAGETAHISLPPSTAMQNGAAVTTQTYQWQITTEPTNESSWRFIDGATHATLDYVPPTAATYYVRRSSTLGDCSDISAHSKIVATPSLISFMSNDEKHLVIDHKNPFTITAGILTGDPHRTYQWQRSLDKSTWTNITPDGTNETYTETMSHAPTVYYRRIASTGTCQVMSDVITVRFKKRYPAMVNPHLRQRVLTE